MKNTFKPAKTGNNSGRKPTSASSRVSKGIYNHLSSDPGVCGGKICIKGTRITVALVLELLASDMTVKQILEEYDSLTREDVMAALRYAAHLAHARVVLSKAA
jgi:uncharacterized protein (DUF433 family)